MKLRKAKRGSPGVSRNGAHSCGQCHATVRIFRSSSRILAKCDLVPQAGRGTCHSRGNRGGWGKCSDWNLSAACTKQRGHSQEGTCAPLSRRCSNACLYFGLLPVGGLP